MATNEIGIYMATNEICIIVSDPRTTKTMPVHSTLTLNLDISTPIFKLF
jgi:hypothetical protein